MLRLPGSALLCIAEKGPLVEKFSVGGEDNEMGLLVTLNSRSG